MNYFLKDPKIKAFLRPINSPLSLPETKDQTDKISCSINSGGLSPHMKQTSLPEAQT